ncbi:MAG: TolC family protein [Candidatus Cloacimonetes bacterium]|nr:TolC family protein [Candidatus Cloacimonadota bacterium]
MNPIRCISRLLVLALVPATTLAAAVFHDGTPLSARETARLALEQGPRGLVIQLDSLSADKGFALGRTPFLPTLSATAGLNAGRTLSSGSHDDLNSQTGTASLNLNWTLFRGLAGLADSRRATAEATRARTLAFIEAENLALEALQGWHALREAERGVDIARESALISRERYQQDSLRRALGAISPQALLNAELALNADRSALLGREQALRAAQATLGTLLGLPAGSVCITGDSLALSALATDDAELCIQASTQGPAAEIAMLDARIADQRSMAARGSLVPRLDLSGSLSHRDARSWYLEGGQAQLGSRSATAGLSLNWDLYTGGQTSVTRQRATIAARQATLRLQDTRLELENGMRVALEAWRTLDRQRELAQARVEVARRQLELLRQQYTLGAASSLDFRDAQVSLASARLSLVSTESDWSLARLRIERLRGQMLDRVLSD